MTAPPPLLTIEEAARALHATVTVSAIRAMIRDGRLAARRIGRRYYVPATEIERLTRCPAPESRPASTSAPTPATGSSATDPAPSGRALALASAMRLKAR